MINEASRGAKQESTLSPSKIHADVDSIGKKRGSLQSKKRHSLGIKLRLSNFILLTTRSLFLSKLDNLMRSTMYPSIVFLYYMLSKALG
jgi:hypothetical protein